MTKVIDHRYGKARVRVLKVLREGAVHTLKDVEVMALLQGDFIPSYTSGDNTNVVATDTIKNTINVFAKQHLVAEIERFAIALGQHFVARYPQVRTAEIEVSERRWERLSVDGHAHPHSFSAGSEARPFTRVSCTADAAVVESGVRDLVILKSTGSGFENYPKDEFTTLPETGDRILATSFGATWHFARQPESYGAANEAILAAMLKVFANNYSPSAQTTLFQMGEAALAACSEIVRLDLAMPNKHCLLINLAAFGIENDNEIFVPTDEPHGQIEVSVTRE
jgi:urate oxidase